MSDIISRLGYEPEVFRHDGPFVKVNGEIVMVRCFNGWFWSLVISGGEFKHGGCTVGYHRLSVLENLRVRWALRHVEKITAQ